MKNKTVSAMKVVFTMLTAVFILGACANGNNTGDLPDNDSAVLPVVGSTIGNFENIEIPEGMTFVSHESTSIRTESFRGGISHYKGGIEASSLRDYILASMKKENWKVVWESSSQDIILAFTKPHRTCMIKIQPNSSMADTTLTMYLTVDLAASRNLNAFGEPI